MKLGIIKLVEDGSPLFWKCRLFVGVLFSVFGYFVEVASLDDGVTAFHAILPVGCRVGNLYERLNILFSVIIPSEDCVVHRAVAA